MIDFASRGLWEWNRPLSLDKHCRAGCFEGRVGRFPSLKDFV